MRSIFYSRRSAVVATVVLFLSGATSAATLAPQEACDLTNGKGLKGLSGFEGTDVVSIIKAYDVLKPKDEFETTAAFKARRTKEVAAAANPLQCIIITGGYQTKYDADHQRLLFAVDDWSTGFGDTKGVSFSVKENFTENSTYAGSNAFGETKDITKTRSKKFGVFFSERNFDSALREAGAKRPEDELVALLPVPLSTEKARANPKDNVALLIQYRWVPDYLSTSWDSHSPTIDEPYENHTSGEYLRARPTRFVVFNKLTGEILLSKATP